VALERARPAAVVGVGAAVQPIARLARRPVVALEQDGGVLAQAGALELVQDLAHAVVHRRDHRRHDPPVVGKMREAVEVPLWGMQRVVRCAVREVQEEGAALARHAAHEADGALGDELGEVLAVPPHLRSVVPEVVGRVVRPVHVEVEDVRVVVDAAREEAEPVVEPALVRARALAHAEVPLAEERGAVPKRAQRGRDRRHLPWEAARRPVPAQDRTHAGVAGIASGEQARARRRAYRRVRVPRAQDRAGRREAVEVRCREVGRPEASEVARRLVVAQDDDEAGRARCARHTSATMTGRCPRRVRPRLLAMRRRW